MALERCRGSKEQSVTPAQLRLMLSGKTAS
jgi:hypothetical protein